MVEEGFEPSKSSDNRFTVCPLWPLGNSTTYGADDRTWTDNLLITSQLLCQLSHTSISIFCFYKWWWKKDSNLRSRPTTDLQSAPFGHSGIPPLMELMIGLEPITCWLQVSCSANWATPAHLLCLMVVATGIEPVTPCL